MLIYSFRNLLICFAIVIIVVLWIVFFTFSTLRSQKEELAKIHQSREVLRVSGPSIIDMQGLESIRANYINSNDDQLLDDYAAIIKKLRDDSAQFVRFAATYSQYNNECTRLADLIHQMISHSAVSMHRGPAVADASGMDIINEYSSVVTSLEDKNRATLNGSYDQSMALTRKTISYVIIIVGVLALVLIISFSFIYYDIKNRKAREAQLEKLVNEKTATVRENEQRLNLIYNTTTDIIFLISVEPGSKYRFTSVNKAFLGSTGLREEQVVGKYVNEVIPPPSLNLVLEKYRYAIQIHRPVEWEEVTEFPSGRKVGIVTVNPVYNSEGECTLLVGVVHDITERKKAEDELVEAEIKFRNLVEQSLSGVYIIQDNKFAYVNPRFAEIFGYKQEELINTNPTGVIMEEDKKRVTENVRTRVAGEKDSIHYEAKGLKKNGELVEIEVFCNGTLYEGSSAIIGTMLDITERKKAEEEIVKANERFSLIARATNDAVWDWDMIKDRNWGNDVFYEYYGTKADDPSDYNTFLSRVHSEDKERILAKLKRAIEKKEDLILDEFRFRMPDGHYRNFYDRAYIIYDKEGKPVRMLGSMMDITEKQMLEQEIVNQKIQAQKMITRAVLKAEETERNKIGQELHDNINQILVSIKMFLSMTRSKDKQSVLQLVDKSTELLDGAIQEIRLLSQSQVTPLKEINLKDLIQSLIDKLREVSTITASFVYKVDDEVVEEELKVNIYRIVQEQINNILKHAEASNVSVSVITDAEFLYVTIADDGKGYDTSLKRKGIGVSNMMNRVESFNGELIIESSPGNGCKLNVRIPC